MLVITSTADLKRYLETRLKFAQAQERTSDKKLGTQAVGMIYAFEESIRAVNALLEHEKEKMVNFLKGESATDV
jgi:hypothetical protein